MSAERLSPANDKVIVVTGKRGSGKSYWIEHEIFNYPRVCIFDVNGDYTMVKQYTDLIKLAQDIRSADSFHCAYVPTGEDTVAEADRFSRAMFLRGDCLVVFDEAHLVAPLHSMPRQMRNLFQRGRHRGIVLLVASQRLAAVNKVMTSQANTFIFFKVVDSRDIEAAQEFLDCNAEVLRTFNKPGQHIRKEF